LKKCPQFLDFSKIIQASYVKISIVYWNHSYSIGQQSRHLFLHCGSSYIDVL